AAELAAIVAGVMDGTVGEDAGYDIAEQVTRRENGFSVFFDLLCDAISDRTRNLALRTEQGREGDPHPARLALLWQDMVRLRAETEQFNLDKQQALLTALARVSGI
ncbi:DNA polymerase III subunit delta', partial [Komagataeibacter sp. FXV3]|nr:DNA polymerase III subunit delta' [Komagataeibacter sp. FXV3]